jgi:hypothetical protein
MGLAEKEEIPIPYRILALVQERNRLFSYPLEQIAGDIWSAKFRCTACGSCCTRSVNPHIFLLDRDTEQLKQIDPSAFEPAPDPEFCDQSGMLYVSGYALRMRKDPAGSCWFLESGKCRIYEQRFSGCRIYPHMLRRSAGAPGTISWRQFARSGRHGHQDPSLTYEDCLTIARVVKEYENAFLSQQIAFLETIHDYFTVHHLYHDPQKHREQVQRQRNGEPVRIRVYHAGDLEEFTATVPPPVW